MTPKLSNLDIPEIRSAAAEWALVSNQIEKITLHRFKPNKLPNPEGPFYSIIIWVSPEVDVNIVPWTDLLEDQSKEGQLLKEQIMKKGRKHPKYKMFHQAREQVREQVRKHPLSGLWNLFWELSAIESKERECFYSFYRRGFERPDPRFDWLVLLLNVGDEHVFWYYDLDNSKAGSAVLFSRKAEVPIQTQAAGPAPTALPDGNTIVRKAQAMAIANTVKRDFPNLTSKEAAKEINARLAAMGAFDKDGKPLMLGYSVKYLMRIINPLGFKLGKPGRKPQK